MLSRDEWKELAESAQELREMYRQETPTFWMALNAILLAEILEELVVLDRDKPENEDGEEWKT